MGWQHYLEGPRRGHGVGPCTREAPGLVLLQVGYLGWRGQLGLLCLASGLGRGQALRAGWEADKGRKQMYLEVSKCRSRGLVGHRE